MYMMSSPVRTAEKLTDGDSLCVCGYHEISLNMLNFRLPLLLCNVCQWMSTVQLADMVAGTGQCLKHTPHCDHRHVFIV